MALLTAASCTTDTNTIHGFETDTSTIDAKASGGKYNVSIRSEREWTAVVDAPWVMVSPANGRGEVRCEVRIDSTLINDSRTTEIRFSAGGALLQSVSVNQEGYARTISTDESEVKIAASATRDARHFEVDEQLKSELLTKLQPAFARISAMGIRYSAIPGHTNELANIMREELSAEWKDGRGIEIQKIGVRLLWSTA